MLAHLFLLMAQLAAFPGAQGGGAAAVGGRGGVVMEITNLNDGGTGSLRACIDAIGPRTCIPRICGLITFLSRAQISNPDITIAGQAAPCELAIGGPNQAGEQIFVSTHDVVVRYLTYDGNNPNTPTGPDTGTVCCEMASGSSIFNVIWDHISAMWTGNKAFPLVSNTAGTGIHNMDIQWSLVYEPNVAHAVGIGTVFVSNGSGLATTDDDGHHNMFVTIDHRLPLNQSGLNVRWVNNIHYNWGMFAALSMAGVSTDYIGNIYKDGNGSISAPGTGGALNYQNTPVFLGEIANAVDPPGDWPNGDNLGHPLFYFLNNTGRTGATRGSPMVTPTHVPNDAGQISMTAQGSEAGVAPKPGIPSGPMPASWFRSSPLPAEQFPIVADDVTKLENVMLPTVGNSQHLDCLGNWVQSRDPRDTRIIGVYQNNLPDDLFFGQFTAPPYPSATPCVESMHDGIPDQYKSAHGLSLTRAVNNDIAPNGDTWLNFYLGGPQTTPPPTTWTGWLGNDALPGAKVGATVVVGPTAGPLRSSPCTVAGGPAGGDVPGAPSMIGLTVTILPGPPAPSPVCSTGGVAFWQVTTGAAPPPHPTVNCVPSSVQTGGTSACSSNQTVTWSASAGSINSAGVFTAPATAQTVTITGTNANGSGTVPITVTAPPPVFPPYTCVSSSSQNPTTGVITTTTVCTPSVSTGGGGGSDDFLSTVNFNYDFTNFAPCSTTVTTGCVSGFKWGYLNGSGVQVPLKTSPTSICSGTTQPEKCTDSVNSQLPMGSLTFYAVATFVDNTGAAGTTAPATTATPTVITAASPTGLTETSQ